VAPATDTDDDLEVAALAVRVAMLAAAHEDHDELAARRQTRAAMRSWGERVPAALAPARDIAILQERHAGRWLREAEAFARAVDPGLAAAGVHVCDYDTLGITSTAGSGFVYPRGLFEVVRHRLAANATPGHIVAVNLPGHVAAVTEAAGDADEAAIGEAVALSLCGTVVHELAHLAVNDAAGRRLPAGITFDDFRRATARPAGDQAANHGPQWIRAFAHSTTRAERLRPTYFWWRLFRDDVRRQATVCPSDIDEALADELTDVEAPIADILRRPAPTAFTDLFDAPAAPAA
jgi:hypothetical protein